jgi:diadenosine tetraphosphate (Ap4A) HIT family hydrolase
VTARDDWQRRVGGEGCAMDAPRPDSSDSWDLIAKLSVSTLYLAKNQTYRGQCVLIFDLRHAARPDQLDAREWAQLCADLYAAEGAVVRALRPDHVNLESLGNVVPHLHWHVVPRYLDDARWGDPIWLSNVAEMRDTRLDPAERTTLIALLRAELR